MCLGILLIWYPNWWRFSRNCLFQNDTHDFSGSTEPIYLTFLRFFTYPQILIFTILKKFKIVKKVVQKLFSVCTQSLFCEKKIIPLFRRTRHCDIIIEQSVFFCLFQLASRVEIVGMVTCQFFETPHFISS